jgi:Uma2 family endonuclease
MGQPKKRPYFTVEQYLAIERSANDRYEFLDGEIYSMAGESWEHGTISGNFFAAIFAHLKGKRCQAQTKDTKVRSGPSPEGARQSEGLYSYPDIVVVCGEPEFHDLKRDIVTNPKVIIEVLSPATENFDRGEKCRHYQMWNETLTDYLLVSQDKTLVEHFIRQADGLWSFQRYTKLDEEVVIASIECRVKMQDIYDRVKFDGD